MILIGNDNRSVSNWILPLFQKCKLILAVLMIYSITNGSSLATFSGKSMCTREREKYPTLEGEDVFAEWEKDPVNVKHTNRIKTFWVFLCVSVYPLVSI